MLSSNSLNKLKQLLAVMISNQAEATSPFRTLLKKEVQCKLKKLQLSALRKLKLPVTTTSGINIFDRNLMIRLKTDASSEGLGALLK